MTEIEAGSQHFRRSASACTETKGVRTHSVCQNPLLGQIGFFKKIFKCRTFSLSLPAAARLSPTCCNFEMKNFLKLMSASHFLTVTSFAL